MTFHSEWVLNGTLQKVVISNIFYFHPYLGKIPILTNIFQMGWNHQQVFKEMKCLSLINECRYGWKFSPVSP